MFPAFFSHGMTESAARMRNEVLSDRLLISNHYPLAILRLDFRGPCYQVQTKFGERR
jgi:hypothetical protein